jgi:hypothetical protein
VVAGLWLRKEKEESMKKVLFTVLCAVLAGCDYTVPLVTTPTLDIDPAGAGLWQRTKDDATTESLLVLPLGKKEYLVSYPAGSKDGMFARGCLWHGADRTLVQLDWFGTAQGKLPDNGQTFQFAAYTIEGETIRIRLLNTDVVKQDVSTSAALAKAIVDNKGNPDLFREAMVFKRLKN